ncbi:hypothetical protein [uncultured Psychrobacter sp.]|uniref:hypothetical protein n=1 Tax=uncultured Psychrobacter sp. TaxID=259303 RepID=UPI0030DA5172
MQPIDREKFNYRPLGDDGDQYSVRDLEEIEAALLTDHYADKVDTTILIEQAKVLKDNYSQKAFVVTGLVEPMTPRSVSSNHNVAGKFVAYEIDHDIGSLKLQTADPSKTFMNLNIEREFYQDTPVSNNSEDIQRFANTVDQAINSKVAVNSIMRSVSDRQAELAVSGDFENEAPDARDELRGHTKLTQLVRKSIEANVEEIDQIYNDKMALERAIKAGFVKADSIDESTLNSSSTVLESHREQMMHKSLTPHRLLVVNAKLLDAEDAEAHTNNRLASVRRGSFMSLGDVESKWAVGKLSDSAVDAIKQELSEYKTPSELVRGISLKQKESNDVTHVFISKDKNDASLFVRAVTVDSTTNEKKYNNAESFDDLGISPASFNQGEVSLNGDNIYKTISYRDLQAREDNMLAQIAPNKMRELISEAQIKERYVNVINVGINEIQPSERVADNIVEAYADDAYKITKFNKRQLSDYKIYAASEDRFHKDNEDITSAFFVENANGKKSIVSTVKAPNEFDSAAVQTYIENFDQNGRRVPDHSFKVDHVAMGIVLNGYDESPDAARVALQDSRNFTSFAFDEQEGIPDRLAIPFGDERKPNPIIERVLEKESKLASESTPDSQETLDNTTRTTRRLRT